MRQKKVSFLGPWLYTEKMANIGTKRHLIHIGRIFFGVSFIFLVGAIFTKVTGGALLGMNQQYLFNDSIVAALFGIGVHIFALKKQR